VRKTHSPWRASSGYTFIEVSVVIALIGIVTAMTVPMLMSFVDAERVRGAAREIVTLMNQARQLAITRNMSFSVEAQVAPQNRLRFCSGIVANPCPAAAVWIDASTGADGWIGVDNQVPLVLAQAITFSSLGAAAPGGRLRVQHPNNAACLDVVVSASGRVQIATSPSCP
jgi:prepilin-type N-terminal cleavage/methylation domain-containing protein